MSPPIHPPEATAQQTYLDDLDRQVAAAHRAGAFTAVLDLARERQTELQHELADVGRGLTLRWVPASEQTEPSPVETKLNRLRWELRQWDYVATRAGEFAANEAHGWTIMSNGTCAKVLANGKVLSAHGGVRYEEEDGTVVDTTQRSDQWHRRDRAVTREFGTRVRGERLARAHGRTRPAAGQSRARERRPAATRRPASSSATSSADPGDPDSEGPEADAARLRAFLVRLISFDWSSELIDSAHAFFVAIEREVTS